MNNFVHFITPEEAISKGSGQSLSELRRAAKSKAKCQCGEPVWKFAGTGLCFTCTTGEWDASGDYELIDGAVSEVKP